MPSSRGSSQSRDRTQVSYIAGRFFTVWATRKAQLLGQPTADGLKGMLVPSSLGLILNVWNKECEETEQTVLCLVTQSCPTLCDPMDLKPTRLLCPWNSPGKNTGVGCHALLQEIFPIQGSNPGLLHYRRILYRLSHQGSPIYDLVS